jgi:hypothetical protein
MQLGDMIFSALDRLGPLPYTLEEMARLALPKLPPGRALADVEKETLRAMAEVLLDDCPVDVPLTEMVDRFERFLVQGQSKRGWRCRMLLTLVEYAPIAAYGRPVRMMSVEQRRRYVREKLMRGGFPWSTCAKVRYLAYAGAYSVPAADAATGFVPFAQRPRASAGANAVAEVRHEA